MSDPVLHPDWHRVAALRPRLAPRLRIERQWVRGARWHVLLDEASGRSARLDPSAYAIAARLDGRRTVHEEWASLDAGGNDGDDVGGAVDPPSQGAFLEVLRQLHRQGLIEFDAAPDFGVLSFEAAPSQDDSARAAHQAGRPGAGGPWWSRIWSWRIPLGDPSPWLARTSALSRALFCVPALCIWLALMAWMLGTLALHGGALWMDASARMGTPRLLLAAAVVYPLIKAIHEAAHALAVHRWGGQVREAGITLMMLMPVPYVDASAAAVFPRASQRMLVSAAGIMAEMALAACGLMLWSSTDDGLAHDIGLVLWFIGGVSTLLFNANPLQRLDGYHVLTDALQLPNLASRSRQWWQARWRRWLSGANVASASTSASASAGSGAQAPDGPALIAPGERPWLIAYAPLAWGYMLGLGWMLSLWLGQISSTLGALMTLAWTATWLVWPVTRWLRDGWTGVLAPGVGTAGLRRLALLVGGFVVVLALPWPDHTLVRGIVWPPEQALVRTDIDGFVDTVHAQDGDPVTPGQLLVTLRNPRLRANREQRAAQLAQAEQDEFGAMGQDAGRAGQAGAEVARLQADLSRLQAQEAALEVRAGRPGKLVLPRGDDLAGLYLKRGDLLGHVLGAEPATVKLAVREADAPEVAARARIVSVSLASQAGAATPGELLRDAMGATRELPSAALGADMGGDIPTDPEDGQHRRTVWPVVLMDIRLRPAEGAGADGPARLGERAWVRIDRGWTPPLLQLARWTRQRMTDVFHPSR